MPDRKFERPALSLCICPVTAVIGIPKEIINVINIDIKQSFHVEYAYAGDADFFCQFRKL